MSAARRALLVVMVCVSVVGVAWAENEANIFTDARLGKTEWVAVQLNAFPDLINARTSFGETPLHYAVLGRQPEVVDLLLAHGADVNAADYNGRTPLHVAAGLTDTKLVARLVEAGAIVDRPDVEGETALHIAARHGRAAIVAQLLTDGANPNALNKNAETPLHVLGISRRPDVDDISLDKQIAGLAQTMIAAGADPTLKDDVGSPAWPHAVETSDLRSPPPGYPSYATIVSTLQNYANTYPNLCQLYDLGASSTTDHLYALKISDNPGVQEDEPEFRIVSTMHGDEVVGVYLSLQFIDLMLTNYGTDQRLTDLVDNFEIWVCPCMNPYGYTNQTRYNANGQDLNRSFPDGAPPSPDANTTAGKQPEVATVMNWGFAQSFTLSFNYHGGALVVNYPFDNDGSGSRYSPDEDLFQYISEEYSYYNQPMWNGDWYHGITNGVDWYIAVGGLQDWSYRYMGDNDVTIELGDTKAPSYSQMPTYWTNNKESILHYMATGLLGVRGTVTDIQTGAPLDATVTVVGRDHAVYTDPDVGDYHRMLLPGSYNLTFDVDGYEPITLPATVASGDATRLDVVVGVPPITYPNGGETLDVNQPTTVTWLGGIPTLQYQVQGTSNYGAGSWVSDDFESGTLAAEYTTGGDVPWFVSTNQAHSGTHAAECGNVYSWETSWLTREVTGNNVAVSFWYKVSSEPSYDFFNFYVDGVRQIHASGEVAWTLYTTTVSGGPHTLKWEYTKDGSQSAGADTAWIDDLSLVDDETVWTDVAALTAAGQTSVPWTPDVVSPDCKVRVRAYYGSGQYGTWDESDATFTVQAGGPAVCAGDCNCDGVVDFSDINPFVNALLNATYCDGTGANADVSGDSQVGFDDINPFVTLLTTNTLPIACP